MSVTLTVAFFFFFFFFNDTATTEIYTRKSSAASDVYKRQAIDVCRRLLARAVGIHEHDHVVLSLIHISEPTRLLSISYAVFCLKKKNRHDLGGGFGRRGGTQDSVHQADESARGTTSMGRSRIPSCPTISTPTAVSWACTCASRASRSTPC